MASRATGGTFAAFLISGAILGFAGGAIIGTQADGSENGESPDSSATATVDPETDGGDTGGTAPDATDEPEDDETPAGDGAVTLTAAQGSASTDERIDLSGAVNPPEEGVRLQLQRSVDGGDFEDFPVGPLTTNADGGFSTYVMSGRKGENAFRFVMVDDPSVASEPVVVTIG